MTRRFIILMLFIGSLILVAGRLTAAPSSEGLTNVGSFGGSTQAIAIEGQYAYIGEGLGLTIMDISDPEQPVVVGRTAAFAPLIEIAVSGNYAYAVADPVGVFWVIDVSDRTAPMPIASDNTYFMWSLAVDGSHLYAGAFGVNGGLHVYDLANPASPQEVGYLDTGAYPDGLAAAGDLAFVGDLDGGLVVVDVSNPAQPVERDRIPIGPTANVQAVAVAGDTVYTEYDGLFRVINVSNPDDVSEVGSVAVFSGAIDIEVAGNVAYVGSPLSDVVTIDISNPADPQELTSYGVEDRVEEIAFSGQHLYVADRAASIWVLDMANPAMPAQAGLYDAGDDMEAVAVGGDYAYLADDEDGLIVVDVSDPALPRRVGAYNGPTASGASGLALDGTVVYLAALFDEMRVVDVSDPDNPSEIGAYTGIALTRDVDYQDGYAYLTGGGNTLAILDVSNPATPTEVATYDLGGPNIEVSGNRAYIADELGGLRVLDISDPQHVTEIGSFDTNNRYALDVALMGNYALLAVRDYYVLVLNVSDPANMQQVGQYDTNPYSIAVAGNRAYVGGFGSFEVLDVSNPAAPTLVAGFEYLGASSFTDVETVGDLAYASSLGSGMQIYSSAPIVPGGDEKVYLPMVRR